MFKYVIGWAVVLLFAVLAGWFFFVKEYDYSISFKTNEVPGEVYQQLVYYEYEFLQKAGDQEYQPFKQISHEVELDGKKLYLEWQFSEEQDSLTRVSANINHVDNSFSSRIKLLFGQEESRKILKQEVQKFQEELLEEAQFYEVRIEGESLSPATTCACIALENQVRHKARSMMKTINLLSAFVRYNNIETIARPRINVKQWDLQSNLIEYEFCFPVDASQAPKGIGKIYLKEFPAEPAIKAIFNGNYMYSHLAWVKILDYAEKNNLEVQKEPLEVFNDNPEMGGDATKWEAEIYMPLN